jgi:hypothetical protein
MEQEAGQAGSEVPEGEAPRDPGARAEGAEAAVELLLAEVIHGACEKGGKPYMAALIKLAAGLPVSPQKQVCLGICLHTHPRKESTPD